MTHRRGLVMHRVVMAAGMGAVLAGGAAQILAAPSYDHIVILFEENKSTSQIIGSPNAPYLNDLAERGLSFTNFFALTHPSQPNYLQFYSGSNQGVIDNTVPAPGAPFSTPNLGAQLLAVGKTFGGYCQDLPSVGSTVGTSGAYRRRHNPWVNWQADPPGANQLLPAVNMPFTSFPSDYSTLPYLSFVVPNLDNDMHDGTVAEGDAWLKSNLGAYVKWAQTHNSLLIVTWDEDNSAVGNSNRIPTIVVGPNVSQGQNHATWTLHNLLRTLEDVAGTAHAGAADKVQPITGTFVTDPAAARKTFQQGTSGYSGARDTHLRQDQPAASFGSTTPLMVDGDDNAAAGNQPVQALIKFDNLFGNGANQIPAADSVHSAKLVIPTVSMSDGESPHVVELHRMLVNWDESASWNSMGGGISADDVEAQATAEFTLTPNVDGATAIFDVTTAVQSWLAGGVNYGWALLPTGTDSWRWNSSEFDTLGLRPSLEVTYAYPTSWRVDANGTWSTAGNWNPGVPNAVEATATFGNVATAPRTITLDAPVLVGKLTFASLHSYTIAGAKPLTLQGGIGNAAIYVPQGSHIISAPIVLGSDTNITVAGGSQLRLSNSVTGAGYAINSNGAGSLLVAGAANVGNVDGLGNLSVSGSLTAIHIRQDSLAVSGLVALNAGGADAGTSRVNRLSITGSGKIDLNNNDLIVQSDAANRTAVLADVTSQVASGGNNLAWNGTGINSSAAAGDTNLLTALGVMLNDYGFGGPFRTTFSGESADANSVLVKYTYYGDADLSDSVDGTDYALIDNGFNAQLTGWFNGDFDYSGAIDGTDYALIDNAYNSQSGPLTSGSISPAVPEPGTNVLSLLAAGAFASQLLRRKRGTATTWLRA